MFDVYWLGQRDQHHLSKESITRLQPKLDLINSCPYETPESSPACSDREMSSSPEVEMISIETVDPNLIRCSSSSSSSSNGSSERDEESSSESSRQSSVEFFAPVQQRMSTHSIELTASRPTTGGKMIPEEDIIGRPQFADKRIPKNATPFLNTSEKTVPGPNATTAPVMIRDTTSEEAPKTPRGKGRKPAGTTGVTKEPKVPKTPKAPKSPKTPSTPKKAPRMKAAPKKKEPAMKISKNKQVIDTGEVNEYGDPVLITVPLEQLQPELEAEGTSNTEKPGESAAATRVRKAWETRKRNAALRAAAEAAALAQEQGTAVGEEVRVQPPPTPKKGGKGRGNYKKKTVRFNIPEETSDNDR